MRILGIGLVLLIGACDSFTGFGQAGLASGDAVIGEGSEPRMATMAFAYAYTLRTMPSLDRVFVQYSTLDAAEVSEPFFSAADLGLPEDVEILPDGDSRGGTTNTDGSLVAFLSEATNLVDWPTTGTNMQLYVRDMVEERTEILSLDEEGFEANAPIASAQISGNGRFVVFATAATNLVDEANGFSQIYVFDLFTGDLQRISFVRNAPGTNPAILAGNGASINPAITADGRYVVFESAASNLVPGDQNGLNDVYLYDRSLQTMERISGPNGGRRPDISRDGDRIAFERTTGGISQIVLHVRSAMVTTFVTNGDGHSRRPAISQDGRFIVYQSDATDLVPNDNNGETDVFLFSVAGQATFRISQGPNGEDLPVPSTAPTISAEGLYISFVSTAQSLTATALVAFDNIITVRSPALP